MLPLLVKSRERLGRTLWAFGQNAVGIAPKRWQQKWCFAPWKLSNGNPICTESSVQSSFMACPSQGRSLFVRVKARCDTETKKNAVLNSCAWKVNMCLCSSCLNPQQFEKCVKSMESVCPIPPSKFRLKSADNNSSAEFKRNLNGDIKNAWNKKANLDVSGVMRFVCQ